jgi:DNA-binding NarL/FixJ family response regulator
LTDRGEVDIPLPVRVLDDAQHWSRAAQVLGSRVRRCEEDGPAVIGILGWTNASKSELDALPAHRTAHSGPLVVLLGEIPAPVGARAVSVRVDGVVLADSFTESLFPTLLAVAAGQSVIPRAIRQTLDRAPLSPRERQILAMVVLDFSNAEIARKLVITESGVKNHLTSAFQKLGVTSRSTAADLILDNDSGLGTGILRILPEETG